MNKYLTYAGQQPVYLGDIDFMQDAVRGGFTQLARAIMNSGSNTMNAILQGVEFSRESSSSVSWTAGIVILNGELFAVAAGTASIEESAPLYFNINVSPGGARTFKDGQTHSCFQIRTATVNDYQGAGGVDVSTVDRLHVPAEVDDRIYEGQLDGGYATSARLVRRSGIWFIDIPMEVPSSSDSTLADVYFYNIQPAHLATLEYMVIPTMLFYYSNGGAAIGLAVVTVLKNTDNRYLHVLIERSGSGSIPSGPTRFFQPLPLF